jgi:casein kinase 1
VLEQIHKRYHFLRKLRGVIHRDIKPENILTGREAEDSQQIYMVDYGVSKFFRDSSGGHM